LGRQKRTARTAGHRQGMQRVKEIVKAAGELGIQVLTLFAFSSENWARPKPEINTLMRFLGRFLEKEIKELDKNNVKFKVIGRGDPLPINLQKKIKRAQDRTKDNSGLLLIVALNYGSRQEIVDAVKRFFRLAADGRQNIEELNEEKFKDFLYTAGLPDPDLLIRTSGEQRISNFLLWQLSYSELYFSKKYWPDFAKVDFQKAIKEYQRRQRRFGKVA
jgi:undecaprenyl diphosphate synthase